MQDDEPKLDWPAIERGMTEHIRGFLAVAAGSPELLKVKCPGLENPETPLEEALHCFVTQSTVLADPYGRDETPSLLARTILPWIDYFRNGGYHPLPVLAFNHFLAATACPSVSVEINTIIAEVELEYAIEHERGSYDRAGFAFDRGWEGDSDE